MFCLSKYRQVLWFVSTAITVISVNGATDNDLTNDNDLFPFYIEPLSDHENLINSYLMNSNGDNNNYDNDEDDEDVEDDEEDDDNSSYDDEKADKRDLIKGPSYTPTINDDIADNDIEKENIENEEHLGDKRKYIPDDNVGSGNSDNINPTVYDGLVNKLKLFVTKRLPSSDDSSYSYQTTPVKKAKVLDQSDLQKDLISESLINLLYDWKKLESPSSISKLTVSTQSPSAADAYNSSQASMFLADSDTGGNSQDTIKPKDATEARRVISALRKASHTFSDKIVANEKDLADTSSEIENVNDTGEDKDEDAEEYMKSASASSRSLDERKNKNKINVMVNVNINERAARRSNVAIINKTNTGSGVASGEHEDLSESSGFLQKFQKVNQVKGESNENDEQSGSGTYTETKVPIVSHFSSSFHPSNSTLNIFAGPAYTKQNQVKIINIAGSHGEEKSDSNSGSRDGMYSGSGESEDDQSFRLHQDDSKLHGKSQSTQMTAVNKPLVQKIHSDTPPSLVPAQQYLPPIYHALKETEEAEKGETAETVFNNKKAAEEERKNNELEHNDKSLESVSEVKRDQAKVFNRAQEDEVKGKQENKKQKSKVKKLPNEEKKDQDEEKENLDKALHKAVPSSITPAGNANSDQANTEQTTSKESNSEPDLKQMSENIDSNDLKIPSAEDVRIEQVKTKPKPKPIPQDITNVNNEKKGVNQNSEGKSDSFVPFAISDEDETIGKAESKIDVDKSSKDVEGRENAQKSPSNDDKYETLEEVREKFKKWENRLKGSSPTNESEEANGLKESDSSNVENSKEKETENKENLDSLKSKDLPYVVPETKPKVTESDGDTDRLHTKPKDDNTETVINETPKTKPKEEDKPAKSNVAEGKELTQEEKDKQEKLKEIEEEKEEKEEESVKIKIPEAKVNTNTSQGEPEQSKEEQAKSWKEEEKILLEKLKNPYLEENSKTKGELEEKNSLKTKTEGKFKMDTARSKSAAKQKGGFSSKPKNLKIKIENKYVKDSDKSLLPALKTLAETKSLFSDTLLQQKEPAKLASKFSQEDKDEVTNKADQELTAVVNQVFATNRDKTPYLDVANKDNKMSQNLSKTTLSTEKDRKEKPEGNLNMKLADKNLKQLAKFKSQILKEVQKIDNLQMEYGTDSHSTKDLAEAKQVLQKDLKVVKELESNLLKKSKEKAKEKSKKIQKKGKKEKETLLLESANHKATPTKHEKYRIFSQSSSSPTKDEDTNKVVPQRDLGVSGSTSPSKVESAEDNEDEIPESKLGFDAESVADKEAEIKDEQTEESEEQKSTGNKKVFNHYEHKPNHVSHEDDHKKSKHPMEDIHALLKAEIKRLRMKKNDHKVDAQLSNIRRLVQQRLKTMLSSGDLDKDAFHSLAPEIKELGKLLKHKINKTNKKKKVFSKKLKAKSNANNGHSLEKHKETSELEVPQAIAKPSKDSSRVEHSVKAESQLDEDAEHIGLLPHITDQGRKKKERTEEKSVENLNKIQGAISAPQDIFSTIQKSHPDQSNKMKTLLTTLNQKIGELYSKASKAKQAPPAPSPEANKPAQPAQNAQAGAQQYHQQQPNTQQHNTQHYTQQTNTQQLQAQQMPSNQELLQNVSSYQQQLPTNAASTMQTQAYAPLQQQDYSTQAQSNYEQGIGNPEANAMYHQTAQGKNELPPPAEDFDDEDSNQPKALADDEPVDTLVESLERDITEVWSYRDMFPDADSLGLDNEKVHNTYANLGSLSGLNLRRALKRALRGEDVGLAVVGGSISKGGPFSEKGLDFVLRSYFYAVEDYWNKIIRPVTGSSMIIRDVSIGGIATDYYTYCLQNHLPDDKLTNIVLWELSANDMRRYEDGPRPKPQPLEQFARNVLSYRARPALIFVNFFALFDWDPDLAAHCRNFEDEGEDDVARYYKITSLSWRNMVCPLLKSGSQPLFTRSRLFAEDNFHPSILGHAQMSYIVIDYIRTEFLKNLVKMRNTYIADAVTRLQIPKAIYIPRPMYQQTFLWKPLCYTYMLVDNRSPNNTLPLDEENSGNFRYTVVREFKIRSDKIVGMETQTKDQFLRYRMHIPRHYGSSEPYKHLGIMSFTDDRSAQVQYDSEQPRALDTKKRFLEGTVIKYVADNITPGEHELTIKSGSSGFLICAVVLG